MRRDNEVINIYINIMNQSIKEIQAWCDMTDAMLQELEKDPQLAEQAIKSGQLDALYLSIRSAVQHFATELEEKMASETMDAETLAHYHQIQEKLKNTRAEL